MGRFSAAQQTTLLGVARAALTNCLLRNLSPQAAAQQAVDTVLAASADWPDPQLMADAACFVTLWSGQHGRLRGCRGEFAAHQPLLAAVAQMALAAALDDPRFDPVSPAEVAALRIEISVLTPLQPIEPRAVRIGQHGLLLARGGRRGLLLPQVPIEHHMNREQFLDALCLKADLPAGAWREPGTALWAFEAEAWEEAGE
jgi:AmmeMemoRadiSam system protein A